MLLRKAAWGQKRRGSARRMILVCAGLVPLRRSTQGLCLPATELRAGSRAAWTWPPMTPGMGSVPPHRKPGG